MAPCSTPKNKRAELELTQCRHVHEKWEMNTGRGRKDNPNFPWVSLA